jgi:O-antigen/teichoic acid export membrane protein
MISKLYEEYGYNNLGQTALLFIYFAFGIATFFTSYIIKKMGYMGWFYSGAIVTILNNITFFYYIFYIKKWRPIYKLKVRRIKSMLKISLPIIPHFYSSYLLEASDRVVMQQMGVSENQIGKFNVSYTLGTIVQGIVGSAGNALIPIYEFYKKKEYIKARSLIYSFIIAFLIFTSVVSLWSKEIFFMLIKNNELAQMYPLSIIIIMAFNYRTLYYGAVNIAFFKKNTKYIWTLSLSAGLINIVLNIIFIPIYI